VKPLLREHLSSESIIPSLSTCGCVDQLVEAFVTLGGEASWMARRHRLAPKLVVSSGKFVAAAILCHKGTWSYSGKEEIA